LHSITRLENKGELASRPIQEIWVRVSGGFTRISFLLSIKGDVSMDYRIKNKEGFSVLGIEGIFTTENWKNLMDIPNLWLETIKDGNI
jgi:hypothetical protein